MFRLGHAVGLRIKYRRYKMRKRLNDAAARLLAIFGGCRAVRQNTLMLLIPSSNFLNSFISIE